MIDKKITIITCFSYTGNKKYVFNSQYLRSDLRRIISFSHNRIGCTLENIHVITDLQPIKQVQEEILNDFRVEVINYLRELKIFHDHFETTIITSPLNWLRCLCQKISKTKSNDLYDKVTNVVLPVIRNSNVVEFASLFTNFVTVTGGLHFDQTLNRLFSLRMSHLFFYYTGHGIRLWSKQTYDIYLVIPGIHSSAEFYSRQDLQNRFTFVLEKIPSFVVFDCCHGEALLKFPYKITFSGKIDDLCVSNYTSYKEQTEIIYLSSTQNNQTCGFYISNDGQGEGSLFTYHLIRFLEEIAKCHHIQKRNIFRLREVENKIQEYRKNTGKKPQNIYIGLSRKSINQFPVWLFNNNENPRFKLVEQND